MLICSVGSPHLPSVASHGSYVQGARSSLALYPLLNSPFSSPWKQNTHGWGTGDGDAFIRGHSPGDSAHLESGPFQASQVGRKIFSKSTSLTPNSPFAADGHRSSFGESLWGSGHSPDLDAEILPALTVCQDDVLVCPPCHFRPLFIPMLSSDSWP